MTLGNNGGKLYGVQNMLFKNATQGHEEKLNARKNKGSAYINMKSFREKDMKSTNKRLSMKPSQENGDKNKENNDNSNTSNLSRIHAMMAIKVLYLFC